MRGQEIHWKSLYLSPSFAVILNLLKKKKKNLNKKSCMGKKVCRKKLKFLSFYLSLFLGINKLGKYRVEVENQS